VSGLVVRRLGVVEYLPTWAAMQDFTARRTPETPDEIWLLQHPPVYTLGLNGKPEHLPRDTDIPVVKIDRGGQITYHGPGQIVAYLLIDLKRRGYGVRELVSRMEQAVIELLADCGVMAQARREAPGVYVGGKKIAALGLRIKRGCSYHGLALNVDMDLAPFAAIDPCGYPGLEVTQTRDLGVAGALDEINTRLLQALQRNLAPPGNFLSAPAAPLQ
jgi:lipoyl(octanoyl) transferase